MRPVSARIAIDSSREEVFELLLDLSVRPAFLDHIAAGYRLLREQPVGVGAGARFKLDHAGGWLDSIIVESDPPHRLVERGHGGRLNRVPNVTEWVLTDTPGPSGCEVAVTFWTEPTTVFDRLSDLRNSERGLRRGLRRALERLRDLAESGEPPKRVGIAGGDRLAPI
jgi:uncharacterized protein YndB with AHSA1/START domain